MPINNTESFCSYRIFPNKKFFEKPSINHNLVHIKFSKPYPPSCAVLVSFADSDPRHYAGSRFETGSDLLTFLCQQIYNLNWSKWLMITDMVPTYSVANPVVYSGIRIRIFPSQMQGQQDSGSGSASENLSILTQKIVSKLSEIWSGMNISNPDLDFLPISYPGVKNAPDPRSVSAPLPRYGTVHVRYFLRKV